MILVWTKSLHIAALVVWSAGLLVLPVLMTQREALGHGRDLDRLHSFTRFAYIVVISPAAFVAVGSGTALILLREVFTPWFAVKLLLVGVLVAVHVRLGLLVLAVFKEEGHFRLWRVLLATVVISALLSGILWVVLAKPDLDLDWLPDFAFEPGGLGRVGDDVIRRLTP
ncbi:CopD family protein [Aureimonas sp. SK2]|uniref:CopD family protein n=1 Tax=Aureimonas sp. SK2 TaxID=3015992 RepID=UPI002443AD36|nr:CopD family protein [Aureimonas sp. SK2]